LKIIDEKYCNYDDYMSVIYEEALSDNNPNSQNLKDIKIKKYISKNIILDNNNNVLAFGAIQDYSSNEVKCARVLTRSYYMKSARNKNFWRNIYSGPIVKKLLSHQIELLTKMNFDSIFVSMETLRKRKVLENWILAVNAWSDGWELLDNMYFTCNHYASLNSQDCWQNIALLKLTNVDFPLKSIPLEEYKERFIKND